MKLIFQTGITCTRPNCGTLLNETITLKDDVLKSLGFSCPECGKKSWRKYHQHELDTAVHLNNARVKQLFTDYYIVQLTRNLKKNEISRHGSNHAVNLKKYTKGSIFLRSYADDAARKYHLRQVAEEDERSIKEKRPKKLFDGGPEYMLKGKKKSHLAKVSPENTKKKGYSARQNVDFTLRKFGKKGGTHFDRIGLLTGMFLTAKLYSFNYRDGRDESGIAYVPLTSAKIIFREKSQQIAADEKLLSLKKIDSKE